MSLYKSRGRLLTQLALSSNSKVSYVVINGNKSNINISF